jgi:predicted metal-dependent peptidase
LVDSVCEPQVDWREQLRLNISTTAGRDEASWVRPNRKRMAIPPHVYLPGMTGHRAGTVVVYGDTSRSVQDNEWSAYFAEMGAIVDELTPEHCYIGSCDTRATDPLEIDSADDVADYKPVGGGGTHLPAIFAKLAEHDIRPDVLVILTDGYTDFGVEPPYPVIWGITSDVVAPYGQTIHIKVTI